MKKFYLLTALLCFSIVTLFAQSASQIEFKEEGGSYYYEEVVEVPQSAQSVIFERAKNWVMSNFKTADNNIVYDDKEFHIVNTAAIKIDPKGFFTNIIVNGTMDFKFQAWFKDGKYRYRIDNMTYYLSTNGGPVTEHYSELKDNKMSNYLRRQASEKVSGILNNFKASMKQDLTGKNKDW